MVHVVDWMKKIVRFLPTSMHNLYTQQVFLVSSGSEQGGQAMDKVITFSESVETKSTCKCSLIDSISALIIIMAYMIFW